MRALKEAFLYELYGTAMVNEQLASLLAVHMEKAYLPNSTFQKINTAFKKYWNQYKEPPSFGVMTEAVDGDARCEEVLYMCKNGISKNINATLGMLEEYIKDVRLKNAITNSSKAFNGGETEKSAQIMTEHIEWVQSFSLQPTDMIDLVETFESRYYKNKRDVDDDNARLKPVTRFYIDELDALNNGRSLRGQLSLILAGSGVGKTHFARHIGLGACIEDGLNVLHIQLEGTAKECYDAYAGSMAGYNAWYYEQGMIPEDDFEEVLEELKEISGKLIIKSYSKFNSKVSTVDIMNLVTKYCESVGKYPDVILIDSLDLLVGTSQEKAIKSELRHMLLNVTQDLSNIAKDVNAWVVATYQATIEDADWLNKEDNFLTRAHLSESKGIIRPLTHLITMNQSEAEKDGNRMRLFIDKSRFFKGKTGKIRIRTNYDQGEFYDREKTLKFETNNV